MEQKSKKVINGYSSNEYNYTSSELEFLQLAKDLATQYQDIYNEKKLSIPNEPSEKDAPQKRVK